MPWWQGPTTWFYLYRFHKYMSNGFPTISFCNLGVHKKSPVYINYSIYSLICSICSHFSLFFFPLCPLGIHWLRYFFHSTDLTSDLYSCWLTHFLNHPSIHFVTSPGHRLTYFFVLNTSSRLHSLLTPLVHSNTLKPLTSKLIKCWINLWIYFG